MQVKVKNCNNYGLVSVLELSVNSLLFGKCLKPRHNLLVEFRIVCELVTYHVIFYSK